MRIKYYGSTVYAIDTGEIVIVTDPVQRIEDKGKLTKIEADICLVSDPELMIESELITNHNLEDKIVPGKRKEIFEISNPGEWEIGGVMIRRRDDRGIYIIDDGYIRLIYIGIGAKDISDQDFKDLGDVDVMIVPTKNGDDYPDYKKLEKVISKVDPAYLIPSFTKDGLDNFLQDSGYTKPEPESSLNVSNIPEKDEREMEVVVLKKY